MKRIWLPIAFWALVLASGIVALARFLHPATFSAGTLLFITAGAFTAGCLMVIKDP